MGLEMTYHVDGVKVQDDGEVKRGRRGKFRVRVLASAGRSYNYNSRDRVYLSSQTNLRPRLKDKQTKKVEYF